MTDGGVEVAAFQTPETDDSGALKQFIQVMRRHMNSMAVRIATFDTTDAGHMAKYTDRLKEVEQLIREDYLARRKLLEEQFETQIADTRADAARYRLLRTETVRIPKLKTWGMGASLDHQLDVELERRARAAAADQATRQ